SHLASLGPEQGNPHGWTWANLGAYPSVLVTSMLWTPAVPLFLIGAALAAWRLGPAGAFLLGGLLVPYVGLTAISNKDPRFLAAAMPAVAVACACALGVLLPRVGRAWKAALVAWVLLLSATALGGRGLPPAVARLPLVGRWAGSDLREMQPRDRGEW